MIITTIDYPIIFICSFATVFLLGLQSKNVNQSRYVSAIITSFFISVANFAFVKYVAFGDIPVFITSATGGCFGIASSIWFYDSFIRHRRAHANPS